jgi:hypothetical protein
MRIESLELLFAKAGQAEARRREAQERKEAKRLEELNRAEHRALTARALAPASAERIWCWLGGADAERLRGWLGASGVQRVALLGWVTRDGRELPMAAYDAWRICLLPTAASLWVNRIGSPAGGGRSRAVDSVARLVDLVPAQIIVALDRALGGDRYQRTVRASLREQMRSNSLPPNIVRIDDG